MAKKIPCDCIGETSLACFHGCCVKPNLLSLPFEVSSQSHSHQKSSQIINNNTNATNSVFSSISQNNNFVVSTLCSLHPNIPQFTNHESLPPLHDSLSYFLKSFPQFSQTQQVDQIRSQDYYHLDFSNHVCFDYFGIGLFSCASKSQHSFSSSTTSCHDESLLSLSESNFFDICYKAVSLKSLLHHGYCEDSELERKMRKRIMDFMNVSEEEYAMVFTSNQSSSFKLIADSYPFESNRNLLMVYDHASEALETMTESSKRRGARVFSAEFSWPAMRLQSRKLRKIIHGMNSSAKNKVRSNNKGLFVFPLQSRMSGSRYSYQWMSVARAKGWHVLLDACALGPKDMETLGLSLFKPDFLICSFYKLFGENPSGFGCLFVKKSTSSILTHPNNNTSTTSIGIVSLIPSPPTPISISGYEPQKANLDSSSDIHDDQSAEIKELGITTARSEKSVMECRGLDHADSLGLVVISTRSRLFINWLVNALTRLQHPYSENGNPLIRIYGPKIGFDRGPSLAFNVFDWKGEKIDPMLVQKLADRSNISLSYALLEHVCFVDKSEQERERKIETCSVTTIKTNDCSDDKVKGQVLRKKEQSGICVITVTIGLVTNFEDIYRLWAFLARFLDADFVEKERWRYLALNQTTIEV